MSSHLAVQTALKAHAGLAALVGARIRPDFAAPEDAYPFVLFKRSRYFKHRGLDNTVHAIEEVFDIECWGSTRAEAVNVFEQATAALEAADLDPEDGEPDGIDPELLERVNVISVTIWTT